MNIYDIKNVNFLKVICTFLKRFMRQVAVHTDDLLVITMSN